MSDEKKMTKLNEEQLEKVTGSDATGSNTPTPVSCGTSSIEGICGNRVSLGSCQQFDALNKQCLLCPGGPVVSTLMVDPGDFIQLDPVEERLPCGKGVFLQKDASTRIK